MSGRCTKAASSVLTAYRVNFLALPLMYAFALFTVTPDALHNGAFLNVQTVVAQLMMFLHASLSLAVVCMRSGRASNVGLLALCTVLAIVGVLSPGWFWMLAVPVVPIALCTYPMNAVAVYQQIAMRGGKQQVLGCADHAVQLPAVVERRLSKPRAIVVGGSAMIIASLSLLAGFGNIVHYALYADQVIVQQQLKSLNEYKAPEGKQ